MTCCHQRTTADHFDTRVARRDLRRFQRRGPDAPTRQLLSAVEARTLPPEPTLLDIGGGVGVIHHVLLERGFRQATHLDASDAYLAAAADQAARLGHAGRVQFRHAEFPAEAGAVAAADVVTLNRVVCCDPDYAGMLGAAASHARHVLAYSYPRPTWLTRIFVRSANFMRRVLGRTFRAYLHPPARMQAVLEGAGMHRAWSGGSWIWAVEVYERAPS